MRCSPTRLFAVVISSILLLWTLGCSGSSAGGSNGGAFVVVDAYPAMNGSIRLNERVRIEFSRPVDLDSVSFNSMPFFVRDANGEALNEDVFGAFVHGVDEDGRENPRVIEFVPRLPTDERFADGGFRPSRNYVLTLVSASTSAAPTVRDMDGRQLSATSPLRALRFQTVSGSTPGRLFRDGKPGGPRVVEVTPNRVTQDGELPLNRMAAMPVSIRVDFDQALSPQQSNLPWRASRDPRDASATRKGRIWLEYDDPVLGAAQWIPASIEVPLNASGGATVFLHPDGVLPNHAELRLIVDAGLADIAGETNERARDYQRVVARFRTEEALAEQFDAVVWDFENEDLSDPRFASFDPPADLREGALHASFDFEGIESRLHYDPSPATNVLSTDFTRLPPANGLPIDVAGGVFRVGDLTVGRGVTVRGVGTNPMVWLVARNVRIDGHLHVDGGRGAQVDGLIGAQYPVAGGQGVCGGGNGGRGSPSNTGTSPRGGNGFGPRQRTDGGGRGGVLACGLGTNFGAGGGGGSHVQQGDTDFVRVFGADSSASGNGGDGVSARPAPGGAAGPRVVRDARDDNDFWGRTVDAEGNVVIGELLAPVGGSGGGAGGDRSANTTRCDSGALFGRDAKGGGGGGGAGVLIVRALGTITIGPEGRITANGGDGGGGQSAGSSRQGGGGAGGSGGMIVLEAPKIELYAHGGRWEDGDSAFSISADGGVGTDSAQRRRKYELGGRPNRGGFGGMGLVQLMTPPGDDRDGTGNVLDDNIVVLDAQDEILPKQQYLTDGDVRPNPVLLPARYGRFSSWSSRYVDTGASVRRVVPSASSAGPRSTTSRPRDPEDALFGPDFAFTGVHTEGRAAGYLRTDEDGRLVHRVLEIDGLQSFALRSAETSDAIARGRAALRLTVEADVSRGARRVEDMTLRLFDDSGIEVGDHRILRADGHELWLDARDGLVARAATRAQILQKFVDVVTRQSPGLGGTYDATVDRATVRVPIANVRIGFAFHKDPTKAKRIGEDPLRFPTRVGTYVYDLEGDGSASSRETLRKLHYRFAKTHVRFNLNYDPVEPDGRAGPNEVGPDTALPAVRWLSLPFSK